MRKSLGDKRKYVPDDAIAEITQLYAEALTLAGQDKRVKVFDREAFGFQRVTVERPLRRVWRLTEEAVEELAHSKAWTAWAVPPKGADDPVAYVHEVEQAQAALAEGLRGLASAEASATEKDFGKLLAPVLASVGAAVPDKVRKAVVAAAAVPDETAPVLTDKRGDPLPDPDLRDQENVPLPPGWFDLGEEERVKALHASAEAHLDAEIRPYAEDAWIDHAKTKVGVEIPFTRHFYEYVPPRPLAEIDAELLATEARIQNS
jgi:type I restriction enzyme M protein